MSSTENPLPDKEPIPEKLHAEQTEFNEILGHIYDYLASQQTLRDKLIKLLKVETNQEDRASQEHYETEAVHIIEEFKERLSASEFIGEEGVQYHEVEKNSETGEFSTLIKNKKYSVNIQTIDSDIVWGIHYKPEEGNTLLKYKILIEETKSKLRTLVNEELSQRLRVSALLEDTFAKKLNGKLIQPKDPIDVGIISELMIREFLKRELGEKYHVERPTPADDFIFKFDFILKLQELEKYGIQITVGSSTQKIAPVDRNTRRWRGELEELGITDFEILAFPHRAIFFKKAFNEWLKQGQPPGGPEHFLDEETENLILNQVQKITAEPSHNISREIHDHVGFSREHVKLERRKLDMLSGEALLDEILALRSKIRDATSIQDPDSVIADIEPSTGEKVQAFIEAVKTAIDSRRTQGSLKENPQKLSDAIRYLGKARIYTKQFPEIKSEIDKLRRKKYSNVVED